MGRITKMWHRVTKWTNVGGKLSIDLLEAGCHKPSVCIKQNKTKTQNVCEAQKSEVQWNKVCLCTDTCSVKLHRCFCDESATGMFQNTAEFVVTLGGFCAFSVGVNWPCNCCDACSEKTSHRLNPGSSLSQSCRNARPSWASPARLPHREVKAMVLLDSVFSEQSWADRGADRNLVSGLKITGSVVLCGEPQRKWDEPVLVWMCTSHHASSDKLPLASFSLPNLIFSFLTL